jgi:hypothetical protein
MRFIAEDVSMHDLKGVVADAKAEAARDAHWCGLKHGALLTLVLVVVAAALCFATGLVQLAPPARPADPGAAHGTGPIGVVPPPSDPGSSAGLPAPPLPGLPPGAVAPAPRLPDDATAGTSAAPSPGARK